MNLDAFRVRQEERRAGALGDVLDVKERQAANAKGFQQRPRLGDGFL